MAQWHSAAPWKHWDAGPIPSLAQWTKDPASLQLQLRLRLWLGCDPWPQELHVPWVSQKRRKKNLFFFLTKFNNHPINTRELLPPDRGQLKNSVVNITLGGEKAKTLPLRWE